MRPHDRADVMNQENLTANRPYVYHRAHSRNSHDEVSIYRSWSAVWIEIFFFAATAGSWIRHRSSGNAPWVRVSLSAFDLLEGQKGGKASQGGIHRIPIRWTKGHGGGSSITL